MGPRIIYEIRDLTHSYGKGPQTLDIDYLRICEGSVTGIVGPNGSGKSTLLRILAFLEPYTGGSLSFESADTSGNVVDIRKNVTYLLQNSYLLKRSVFENIAYGLRLKNETEGLHERVYDSLERVGLSPKKFAQRPWYRLSGGEVQRVWPQGWRSTPRCSSLTNLPPTSMNRAPCLSRMPRSQPGKSGALR